MKYIYIFALLFTYYIMCTEINMDDYNVQIDAELYNCDYDVIDSENQSEHTTESDILFE